MHRQENMSRNIMGSIHGAREILSSNEISVREYLLNHFDVEFVHLPSDNYCLIRT